METNDPSGRLTVEELSDCRSDSSHSETQLRAFQDYERIKELNLSVEKAKEDSVVEPKDFHLGLDARAPLRFDEFPCEASTRNLSMAHNKHKDFGYIPSTLNELNYPLDRPSENEESIDTSENLCRSKNPKELMFNIREGRQKNTPSNLSPLDRYGKDLNFAMEKDIKDFGMLKSYGLERMKEFNLSLDRMRDNHISNFALERLRGGGGTLMENSSILEANDFKSIQAQPRNQDLEAIALERMRRSQLLGTDLSVQNLSTQLPHTHALTQMQHSQQQQQQQAKSFTIDAILGLRNNQREKRGQQQQYRKHQSAEGTKNSSSSSCSNSGGGGGGGGKLKRVRTIFTAEQLERLEGEFARQQYMVGPERLYLAHALRLTEAQVKVWFQNRRIKWRKHHHEQQSQRVHEFQRSLSTSLEHEDSNEADKWKMKPVDRQKGKCGSSQSWTPKYTTNADLTSDAYWKYPQGKNLTVPLSRSRSPTAAEQMANYYAAKVHKNHGASKPSYFPHIPTRSADAAHRIPEKYMTCNREKYYAPSAAPLRRSRYEPDTENENEKEYGEVETDNLTEDVGEDAGEEAEEDAEGLCEYADKECEDHEADDEIDEESDASPQARRTSRPLSKDALQRAQRWKAMEQEDPRRYRGYDQRISAGQCHPSQARRYYSPERELQEPLTDEEIAAAAANPRNPRRSPMDYYNWQQSRSYIDHYDPTTFPIHRRARTKLEIDSPFDLEFARAKKCSRCGYVPNKKTPLTNKHNCRFDDRLRFYAKGSIGDEFRDDTFHGCNAQSPTNCDYPSSAPCTMDSRRSREVKSPSYEAPEHDRLLNKIPTDQAPPRRYTREASEASPDKNKRFVAPAYGSTRLPSRF